MKSPIVHVVGRPKVKHSKSRVGGILLGFEGSIDCSHFLLSMYYVPPLEAPGMDPSLATLDTAKGL
jgi:hypothetical protein